MTRSYKLPISQSLQFFGLIVLAICISYVLQAVTSSSNQTVQEWSPVRYPLESLLVPQSIAQEPRFRKRNDDEPEENKKKFQKSQYSPLAWVLAAEKGSYLLKLAKSLLLESDDEPSTTLFTDLEQTFQINKLDPKDKDSEIPQNVFQDVQSLHKYAITGELNWDKTAAEYVAGYQGISCKTRDKNSEFGRIWTSRDVEHMHVDWYGPKGGWDKRRNERFVRVEDDYGKLMFGTWVHPYLQERKSKTEEPPTLRFVSVRTNNPDTMDIFKTARWMVDKEGNEEFGIEVPSENAERWQHKSWSAVIGTAELGGIQDMLNRWPHFFARMGISSLYIILSNKEQDGNDEMLLYAQLEQGSLDLDKIDSFEAPEDLPKPLPSIARRMTIYDANGAVLPYPGLDPFEEYTHDVETSKSFHTFVAIYDNKKRPVIIKVSSADRHLYVTSSAENEIESRVLGDVLYSAWVRVHTQTTAIFHIVTFSRIGEKTKQKITEIYKKAGREIGEAILLCPSEEEMEAEGFFGAKGVLLETKPDLSKMLSEITEFAAIEYIFKEWGSQLGSPSFRCVEIGFEGEGVEQNIIFQIRYGIETEEEPKRKRKPYGEWPTKVAIDQKYFDQVEELIKKAQGNRPEAEIQSDGKRTWETLQAGKTVSTPAYDFDKEPRLYELSAPVPKKRKAGSYRDPWPEVVVELWKLSQAYKDGEEHGDKKLSSEDYQTVDIHTMGSFQYSFNFDVVDVMESDAASHIVDIDDSRGLMLGSYVSAADKHIILTEMYKTNDPNIGGILFGKERELHASDALFESVMRGFKKKKAKANELSVITISNIANVESATIFASVSARLGIKLRDWVVTDDKDKKDKHLIIEPGKHEEEFHLLLGTKNIKPIARMLIDHQDKLGKKTIQAVFMIFECNMDKVEEYMTDGYLLAACQWFTSILLKNA